MSIIFGHECARRAKKPHRCEECGHEIPAGTLYHVWEGMTDDSDGPYAWKSHLNCRQAMLELNDISGWEQGDTYTLGTIIDILSEFPDLERVLRRSYPLVALRFARNRQAAEARSRARIAEDREWRMIRANVAKSPAPLIEAAQDIVNLKFSTFKARNGRDMGVQGDDGEMVWLVHSDQICALEQALRAAGMAI